MRYYTSIPSYIGIAIYLRLQVLLSTRRTRFPRYVLRTDRPKNRNSSFSSTNRVQTAESELRAVRVI